jgi:hypothetical protein
MDAEAQRLLKDFTTHLNRTVPQPEPAEWPRLYDFIIHVTRREAPSAEAVGHALVQAGLDWEEVEPYVTFYARGVALLGRAREGSHHASLACEADGIEEAGSLGHSA